MRDSLLDTHVFLWYIMGDSRLSDRAREIVEAKSDLHFSIINLWEIAIKVNVGKLQLNVSFEELRVRLKHIKAAILPVSVEDTQAYTSLLLPPNHRDPFDRILICQAANRSLVLVSADAKFDAYSIQRFWTY